MKTYTDKEKVNTRDGHIAGRNWWLVPAVLVVCIFVIMPAVVSCSITDYDKNVFVVEYQIDNNDPERATFPKSGLKFMAPDWFYYQPTFQIGPFSVDGANESYDDSLARFFMELTGPIILKNKTRRSILLRFYLKSDTSFFFEREAYYMSQDTVDLLSDAIRAEFPNTNRSALDLLRDSCWACFQLRGSEDIWFSIEFECVFAKDDNTTDKTRVKGQVDVYYTAKMLGLKTISPWIKKKPEGE